MAGNAEAMVLASFAADTLALGAHWIYDTRQIDARFGRVTDFLKPSPPTYHPTKARGELTHYGDQTLVLLRSVSACGGFDEDTLSAMRRFGQMCEVAAAFPATVHLIAKYEDRLKEGLIENVMAGGDSAGHGLLAGLVLGAWGGRSAIPECWLSGLAAAQEITRLLAQIQAGGKA
jgi:ADP-ribosylglycohydrolase